MGRKEAEVCQGNSVRVVLLVTVTMLIGVMVFLLQVAEVDPGPSLSDCAFLLLYYHLVSLAILGRDGEQSGGETGTDGERCYGQTFVHPTGELYCRLGQMFDI